jgi:hypothetical protein
MSDDKSSAALAVRPTSALVPRSMAEAEHMASVLCKSQLVPDVFKNKPADTFLAIAYGMEIGIPPVSSLRAVAVIKGKPSLYADAMVGLVLASGKAKYFTCVESNASGATYETHRIGSPKPVRKSFTLDDAKQAKLLSNDNYGKYPSAMLEARAKSKLARDAYPDLLHGIYSAEEVAEFDDRGHVIDVTPEPVARPIEPTVEPDDDLVARLETSIAIARGEGLGALEELAGELKTLPMGPKRDSLRKLYREAWVACSEQAKKEQAPRTAGSRGARTSQSRPSPAPDSTSGPAQDGPTIPTTTSRGDGHADREHDNQQAAEEAKWDELADRDNDGSWNLPPGPNGPTR